MYVKKGIHIQAVSQNHCTSPKVKRIHEGFDKYNTKNFQLLNLMEVEKKLLNDKRKCNLINV